jgi:hypothetical protein
MKDFWLGVLVVYGVQALIRQNINNAGLEITSPGGLAQLAALDPVAAWGAYSLQGSAK